ncbi:MAG: glycoside hydrolase family 2, partial [Gammaproteobacteria bacterium]|nr:glycoside hydrolase family 2 [Gammaproteobacteria bacterium]
MYMIRNFILSLTVSCSLVLSASESSFSFEKQSFNDSWHFIKGDVAGAEKLDFDHSKWRTLRLPHDWAIEGPFSKKYSARNGGLPVFGTAWYRKDFTLPEQSKGKLVSVFFDGVMANSEVYVNGVLIGKRPFGYIGFQYEISKHLKPVGETNVIAVKVAPENYAARWYSGSGIYRNTWIEFNNPTHIAPWSTQVSTPTVQDKNATVLIKTVIDNQAQLKELILAIELQDANGNVVSYNVQDLKSKGQQTIEATAEIGLLNPRRWDIDDPYRYKVVTKLLSQERVIDTDIQPLGVRSIEYKPDDGFWLNGRRVQIQGVCLHHDNGPLGAVANTRAIERKLEIMQDMGVNAVRTSHNPPSPELVELADKMGILLQVEAFDTWLKPKATVVNGYHKYYEKWSERDLSDMVKQNRNHPSVIMWSIGNEIHEQKNKDGWKFAKRLTEIVKRED